MKYINTMTTIFVKSVGYNCVPFSSSQISINNLTKKINERGINIFFINNKFEIIHSKYDTFIYDFSKEIVFEINKSYDDSNIFYIGLIIHDEGSKKINLNYLKNEFSKLQIKLIDQLKYRYSYFFIYDNINKKLMDEQISPNLPIENTFEINNVISYVNKIIYIKNVDLDQLNLLNKQYDHAKNSPSDINQHIPTLYNYSKECESIIECGVRSVISSWAFLKGLFEN